jgi:flavin-dependent dehydrogenase
MKIKTICIVGGGSSGWMMAVALNKQLPKIKVTLVESPITPTVGVGESTIPYVTSFIKNTLGFAEKEWMPACDASYKSAIKFNHFVQKGESFYHPFWTLEEANYNGYDWAIKKNLTNLDNPDIEDYYSSSYIAYHMCVNNKFNTLVDENFSYAHHVDATKFGEYCKSKFKGKHVIAHVNHVKTKDSTIVSVTTDKGVVKADMFIDCTGFHGLLIDKALHESFESISDTLLNDTAITCRMPYAKKSKELESFTDCTALSSGWVWNTPLWSRMGTGYVFSSRFQSQEDAQKEFKNYLVKRFDKKRVDNAEFNIVQFKTGKYKRGWVGNCLALTLASGFIEPLESTGLALACYQINNFIEAIKDSDYSAFGKKLYNRELDKSFEEIHNFVLLHYVNTKREDSKYWQHIKNNLEIPESLAKYVESETGGQWFPRKSRESILIGINGNAEYSPKHLAYNGIQITNANKKEQEHILTDLEYLKRRKVFYKNKALKMEVLDKYLATRIYL